MVWKIGDFNGISENKLLESLNDPWFLAFKKGLTLYPSFETDIAACVTSNITTLNGCLL